MDNNPQKKINTDSSIRLLEVPKRIIEKYKGYTRDNRIFPIPSNATCKKILKKIAEQCGIKTWLSYHCGRHRENFYQLLINRLLTARFSIGNDLETSLILSYIPLFINKLHMRKIEIGNG